MIYSQTDKKCYAQNHRISHFLITNQNVTQMKTCGLDVLKDMIFCTFYNGKKPSLNQLDTPAR